MYYYDINAKITLIEKLITEFRGWNILIMDFDTQFTSLKNNQALCSKCDPYLDIEIFLPYQITHSAMVDKVIEYDKCNSLIVIDSLNGLLDYFNFYGINEIANNDKNMKGLNRIARLDHAPAKDAGYKSLNLIKIIFECHPNKEIPVIITSYQSQSSIDRLISETISDDAFPYQENNHFRRISNLVSLLEYFQDKDDLFITILKKTPSSAYKTLPDFPNFPHTRKIIKKPSADFNSVSLGL
jgi:hypothetical protein